MIWSRHHTLYMHLSRYNMVNYMQLLCLSFVLRPVLEVFRSEIKWQQRTENKKPNCPLSVIDQMFLAQSQCIYIVIYDFDYTEAIALLFIRNCLKQSRYMLMRPTLYFRLSSASYRAPSSLSLLTRPSTSSTLPPPCLAAGSVRHC